MKLIIASLLMFVFIFGVVSAFDIDLTNIVNKNTLKQFFANGGNGGYDNNGVRLSQTFNTTGVYNLSTIGVYLKVGGGSPTTATVSLVEVTQATNAPDGNTLSQGTISLAGINASYQWFNVTLATPLNLSSNYSYAITISDQTTNYIQWEANSTAGYENGSAWLYNGTHNIRTGADHYFRLYSAPYERVYNSTAIETSRQSFVLNITNLSSSWNSISGSLIYNNVTYSSSKTYSGDYLSFSSIFDAPVITLPAQTNWFYWSIALTNSTGTYYGNTTQLSQTMSSVNLTQCTGAPLNIPFMNITFKNETTGQERVTASIVSTWNYYLGSGAVNKTLSYTNTSEYNNYTFCASPSYSTLYVTPTVSYYNAYSLQRSYSPGLLTLTNTTTEKTLYLLPNSLGSSVTFQVVSPSLQPISGATVAISSSFGAVESKVTDSSGGAGFWLNPLTSYTVTASKDGYPSSTSTVTPGTQTSYTITLGTANVTSNLTDYYRGIGFSITPVTSYLSNGTVYPFNFTLNSTYHLVDSFGFTLTNSSGYVFNTASTTTNGATVSASLNTGANNSIYMNYYWVIGGVYANGTRTWIVYDDSETSNSIAHFVTSLKSYLNTDNGILGLKKGFSMNIIIFLIAFSVTGIISYKFGFTSITPVLLTLTLIVAIFDTFALDLITYSGILEGGIGNKATTLLGIITIGAFIKENYS